ncbi:MAG: L,D-transpeptidase family protein [Sphingobium sp.]
MLSLTPFGRHLPAPLLALLIAAMSPAPAFAQGAMDEARPLAVGQFLWDEPGTVGQGDLAITISIAEQRLFLYRDGRLIGMSTVSTGARGHATPLGDFTILQKNMWHRSNLYSNAPMPYMQRLTWTGIAIHAGHLPGYPASHGCIRLPTAFAKRLFGLTTLGVPVTIVDAKRRPLVKLQFADIEWLIGDEIVQASPALRNAGPMREEIVDDRAAPPPRDDSVPHWADRQEMDAVRTNRRPPSLPFEPMPL